MACPTCDHTMCQIPSFSKEHFIYHCPRCGTVKLENSECYRPQVYVPKLVSCVVEFCGTLTEYDQRIIDNLERIGVTESATHPDARL